MFGMADVRRAALAAHEAAREVADNATAHSAARAARQTMATAHVARQSLASAVYAATAVRDGSATADVSIDWRALLSRSSQPHPSWLAHGGTRPTAARHRRAIERVVASQLDARR